MRRIIVQRTPDLQIGCTLKRSGVKADNRFVLTMYSAGCDIDSWVEVAPMFGTSDSIDDLLEFDGSIFGADGDEGHLLRWNNVAAWEQAADTLSPTTKIYTLCEHNSELYGSGNNGNLYVWNGVDAWVQKTYAIYAINKILSFDNKIYGGGQVSGGDTLFEWSSGAYWTGVAAQYDSTTIADMVVFDGKIYAVSSSPGYLLEWSGSAWVQKGGPVSLPLVAICEFNGKLYAGSSNCKLYEWDGVSTLTKVAETASLTFLGSLGVFENNLYAGTSILGSLYRWNGVDAWEDVTGPISGSPPTYTTTTSLLVHDSKLYGGTGWTSYGGKLLEAHCT